MIDINLVPISKRKTKGKLLGGINIPLEVIVGSVGALFVLIILVHVSLVLLSITKLGQYKIVKREWEAISSSKANVDVVLAELRSLQASSKAIGTVAKDNKILWSQKLNIISNKLPKSTWLRKIALGEEILVIEGSAISKQRKEMLNVHEFIADLNKDKDFMEHFSDFELASIQRRKVQKTEIADFTITAKLKE